VVFLTKKKTVITPLYVFGRRAPIHNPGFFHTWKFSIHNVEDVEYTSVI
jgi:hypothetical protein